MNNKKILTFSVLLIIIVILGGIVWGSKNKKNNSSLSNSTITKTLESNIPIYFYGNTCPHCVEVKKWMRKNKIEEKVKIIKKEVYNNRANAEEMIEAAKRCGLSTENIGVPFLFAEGKCFIGTPDVVSFLAQKAGIEKKQ
ncbi:MAG: glutaredoxin family protein [Microgenomates group bacterium]